MDAPLPVPLLDHELWPPLAEGLRGARRDVILTQLLFEADFRPWERPLAEELEHAAERGARVRVLVNENAAIPDSHDELLARFAGTRVEVRALTMTPNVMHSKLVVLDDDEAFMVDPPFEQKYVDHATHPFAPAAGREKPFHAVSLHLRGAAARPVRAFAERLWDAAGGPLAQERAPPRGGIGALRFAATAPAGILAPEPVGEVLQAYLDAIAGAERLLYIETQYFTSPRIREAVSAALARAPQLEAILLLNVHMDVPGYDLWQARRLEEIGDHPRLGVFARWAPRRAAGTTALRQLYLHSKVGIVDDRWATVGSANLDSVSLHESEEFPVRVPRNVELNAVVTDPAWVTALRRRLWGEHLADEGVWRAQAPAGGWLAHWRAVAEENVRRFDAGEARVGTLFPFAALTSTRRETISRPHEAPS